MTPRTLREELRRMNREQLTAVAENWGISDPAGRLTGSEIRDLLVPRILNSVSLREKLDEAPAGTDLALRALIGYPYPYFLHRIKVSVIGHPSYSEDNSERLLGRLRFPGSIM